TIGGGGVTGAAERQARAGSDGSHRRGIEATLLEEVEGGAQDDRPRGLPTTGFGGGDGQSDDLGSGRRLVGVVVDRRKGLLAKRPSDDVQDEQVVEVHEAKHEKDDADSR